MKKISSGWPICINTRKTFHKNEERRNLDLFSDKDREMMAEYERGNYTHKFSLH